MINRINYKNDKRDSDFEIIDLPTFFTTRPKSLLEKDFRLNFWSIIYITEGSGHHFVDFIRYPYKKGDIIFVQKNQVHHFEVNQIVKGWLIHLNEPFFYRIKGFKGDIFLDLVDQAAGIPVLPFKNGPDTTNRILIDLIHREYEQNVNSFDIELIASLFRSFILSLRPQLPVKKEIFQSKDYENFKTFRTLVETNYTTTRNVEDYANRMNLSRKTINQATRNVAGLSAKQFIINRITLEIKRHLSLGELMNYEIADLMGFDEPANMSKFFMRYEGLSPKDFRDDVQKR
ncbi:MAG: helix-turn-helix domain-containing protein [Spirochaetales bacterium]|nr:helix-turn-helix domain-containing protein [Spirochaetales bacterium]